MRKYIYLLLPAITSIIFSCSKTVSGTGGTGTIIPGESFAATGGSGGSGSNNVGDTTAHNTGGILTSGEWNDHDNWNFWTSLMKDTFGVFETDWGFYAEKRWTFTITDINGNGINDAVITIKNNNEAYWVCRTNKFGVAQFLPVYSNGTVPAGLTWQVSYNNLSSAVAALPSATEINYAFKTTFTNTTDADIMFVVDATGSMGDELSYIQKELENVLQRINDTLQNTQMHYAGVFYRDENQGDAYVTRHLDFTTDAGSLVNFVKQQSAEGGGDYPEAVDAGLQVAMQQHWDAQAKARILFLILDAPPHDTPEHIALLQEQVQLAASKGVIIIPLAASGTDKSTEFLLRFMELATNGTYTFLTDDSGIGNTHLKPTVGHFNVEFLNNQVVRLIAKYAGN
jgi:hypothetical protein